jgi:hypothetical protein
MRLGEEIEIVGPKALREAMTEALAAMLRRHTGEPARPTAGVEIAAEAS